MLRALLILVVLANALFFAWSRGWLAPAFAPPHAGEREPERLNAQLRPDDVIVLPATAASAAISAARAAALACLEAGPLAEAEVGAAETAIAAAQIPEGGWLREAGVAPPPWLVFAGRAQDGAGLRARADELKKLNLEFEIVDAPPELANGFVLSRHATRTEAETALAAATATGLRGARVAQLPASPPQFWLRAPRADSDQQDKLRALPPEHLAGGFKPCAATAAVAPPAVAASSASGVAAATSAASAAAAKNAAASAASAVPASSAGSAVSPARPTAAPARASGAASAR